MSATTSTGFARTIKRIGKFGKADSRASSIGIVMRSNSDGDYVLVTQHVECLCAVVPALLRTV